MGFVNITAINILRGGYLEENPPDITLSQNFETPFPAYSSILNINFQNNWKEYFPIFKNSHPDKKAALRPIDLENLRDHETVLKISFKSEFNDLDQSYTDAFNKIDAAQKFLRNMAFITLRLSPPYKYFFRYNLLFNDDNKEMEYVLPLRTHYFPNYKNIMFNQTVINQIQPLFPLVVNLYLKYYNKIGYDPEDLNPKSDETNVSNRLTKALRWLVLGSTSMEPEVQISCFVVALEALLTKRGSEGVTKLFKERLKYFSKLFKLNLSGTKIDTLYDLRSTILHGDRLGDYVKTGGPILGLLYENLGKIILNLLSDAQYRGVFASNKTPVECQAEVNKFFKSCDPQQSFFRKFKTLVCNSN